VKRSEFFRVEYPKGLPILLAGEIQRSGETLFSQLMDGHSEILAHPFEVKLLKKQYTRLPEGFQNIIKAFEGFFKNGYKKGKLKQDGKPFYFLYREFEAEFKKHAGRSNNEMIDFYFDNFHSYWLNHHDLFVNKDNKKLITGFSLRLAYGHLNDFLRENERVHFLNIYRHPASWWSSARLHSVNYRSIEAIDKHWLQMQNIALDAKQEFPDRCLFINFDDLVLRTKDVMEKLCKMFAITYESILTQPTFNTLPIRQNTSFRDDAYGQAGVNPDSANRYKSELTENEIDYIQRTYTKDIGKLEDVCAAFFL